MPLPLRRTTVRGSRCASTLGTSRTPPQPLSACTPLSRSDFNRSRNRDRVEEPIDGRALMTGLARQTS